jgi:hypothetical protein
LPAVTTERQCVCLAGPVAPLACFTMKLFH